MVAELAFEGEPGTMTITSHKKANTKARCRNEEKLIRTCQGRKQEQTNPNSRELSVRMAEARGQKIHPAETHTDAEGTIPMTCTIIAARSAGSAPQQQKCSPPPLPSSDCSPTIEKWCGEMKKMQAVMGCNHRQRIWQRCRRHRIGSPRDRRGATQIWAGGGGRGE